MVHPIFQSKFFPGFARTFLTLVVSGLATPAHSASCQKTLAQLISQVHSNLRNAQAEGLAPETNHGAGPNFTPALRTNLKVLADFLNSDSVGFSDKITFSHDFSAATISSAGNVVLAALNKNSGSKRLLTYLPIAGIELSARSNGKNRIVLLGHSQNIAFTNRKQSLKIVGGSYEKEAEKALQRDLEAQKAMDQAGQKPGSDEIAKNDASDFDPNLIHLGKTEPDSHTVSQKAVLLNAELGFAAGINESGQLEIFESVFDSAGVPAFNRMQVRLANEEPVSADSKLLPNLSRSDFLIDPNSKRLALRLRNLDGGPGTKFYMVDPESRAGTDGDIAVGMVNEKLAFSADGAEAFSFAFLPATRAMAFKDQRGDLHIQQIDQTGQLRTWMEPAVEPNSPDHELSEQHLQALSFPKVISAQTAAGEFLIVLEHDGKINIWDAQKAEMFRLPVEENLRDGFVDILTLQQTGLRYATATDHSIKIRSTLAQQTLLEIILPADHLAAVKNILFTPDGSGLLVVFRDGSSTLFDSNTGEIEGNYNVKVSTLLEKGFEPQNLQWKFMN